MGMWIGRNRKARVTYGFDEIALVPGRVTINPNEVDITFGLARKNQPRIHVQLLQNLIRLREFFSLKHFDSHHHFRNPGGLVPMRLRGLKMCVPLASIPFLSVEFLHLDKRYAD